MTTAESAPMIADDGHRLAPRYAYGTDDTVPCRWWHWDFVDRCARCSSRRMDLHDGDWSATTPNIFGSPYGPRPWTERQRAQMGLPVEPQWWHQAAGWPV